MWSDFKFYGTEMVLIFYMELNLLVMNFMSELCWFYNQQ